MDMGLPDYGVRDPREEELRMVQTIGPDRRAGDRRMGERRGIERPAHRTETTDMDGVLYRLGQFQRVLIDVRAQVRELQAYAEGAEPEAGELDEGVVDQIGRRLDAIEEALDGVRDDFDLAREAVERSLDDQDSAPIADVISLSSR
jgi:hypothetical protein